MERGFTREDLKKAIKESQLGKTPQDISEKDEAPFIQSLEKEFGIQRDEERNLFKEYAKQPDKQFKHKVLVEEKGITDYRIRVFKKKGLLTSNKPRGADSVIFLTDEMKTLLRKLHSEEKPNE